MAVLPHPIEISVTEAARRGIAELIVDAERGLDLIVMREGRPVAAVVGITRLHEIEQTTADLSDLAAVLVRSAMDEGRRTSLDDVLDAFGQTPESLAALPDEE
jgi:antitoxin (DNA-binding transcriptional repressor) of toxin-antitoxin stability system